MIFCKLVALKQEALIRDFEDSVEETTLRDTRV